MTLERPGVVYDLRPDGVGVAVYRRLDRSATHHQAGTVHWRADDQHGVVLDIQVQDRRNAAPAKRRFNPRE